MTVRRVRVGDVLELQRRSVTVDPTAVYRELGVRSFGKGTFHKEPLLGAELGGKRVFRIEPGDLVLSNVFAWEGAVAVATDEDAGRIGSHRFMTYTAKTDDIDLRWAHWFFLSEPGLDLIRSASPGSAGRNKTLAIDRFENLEIPLPPIEEQRRIAARLDLFRSSLARLDQCFSARDVLRRALPFAVHADLQRTAEPKLAALGDCLDLEREPLEIDPLAPYVTLGIKSFGNGAFLYPSRPGSDIGKLRFFNVPARRLAVSNIQAWEGAVAVTDDGDVGAVASNRFLFFRPKAGLEATEYFWALLLSPEGMAAVRQAAPGTAVRNRTLSLERFLEIRLPIADPVNQVAIGRQVRRIRDFSELHEGRAGALVSVGKAVLPAALNEAFADLT